MGTCAPLPPLNQNNSGSLSGGDTLLRKSVVVEVQDDHIVVRVTGTSYAASCYRKSQTRLNSYLDVQSHGVMV